MEKVRVLVVDDSFFMRRVIGDFLRADPAIDVVGEAGDGIEALAKIKELQPHVVTLDIEMPRMNGIKTLAAIVDLPKHPSVVMVSGYVPKGADITLQCLSMGAADFILKPSGSFSLDMDKVKDQLVQKVKVAAKADVSKIRSIPSPQTETRNFTKKGGVVVLGASTGGPAALEVLLPAFPQNFPYPIAVAQHLPKTFLTSFIERLKKKCQLQIIIAENNMELKAGTIYIASGDTTTTIIEKDKQAIFSVKEDTEDLETPSIDALMTSAADLYHDKTVGAILTGMGRDGTQGMASIKQAGGRTIAQDEATSIVFGMAKEVISRGLADDIKPLDQVVQTISDALV